MSVVILQSRRFWVLYLAAALIASLAAFQMMFNSMPVLKVDIEFSRTDAVAAAAQFQQKQFPDLKTERSAAVFISNRGLQNYVELEAGGLKVYNEIINNPDAMPHYWKVRRFAESQEKELTSAFSPKGLPLSFWLTIPDQEPGVALEEAAARTIAEQGAQAFLGERFNAYKPFETVVKRQTSGRADHIFTYEHESLKLAEARFRLVLRVAGDKLVGIDTLSHIPQAFDQRFDEMRAVNNQISQVANYLMVGLLVLGGLVGGGIWLHRRHQLRWKPALLLAAIVAIGLAAGVISNLPMSWMGYPTTVSANNFLLQQVAGAGMIFVGGTLILGLIFCVAEGLSRMAFANHPKLFDFFRTPVAASPEALGRVLGAYGWAGFFLLYAMAFQLISRHFGWWSPTDTETDPNILASWRPALGPIFTALQAGTWEECLFRAVPLSLAAIIGQRFGQRRLFIAIALVVQALIFGGAHASYPNLPGYSRLVELFIPAMAFGLVYLRFGLVMGMLTHFIYDLVLMSLPIFLSNDPSLLIDKVLVVLAGMAPLLILLWARYKSGAAIALADAWRNGVPVDPTPEEQAHEAHIPVDSSLTHESLSLKPLSLSIKLWLPLVIIAVIAIFMAWGKPPEVNWPQYTIDRAQAKAMAEAELTKHGAKLEGEWHSTVMTHSGWRQPMDFVWRETDKTTFESLLGRYLDNPLWRITWRKFDGPVEERSEEWSAYLEADGSLHELVHTLPEGRAGAKLSREQATAKALGWIVARQWGTANQLAEKSVEETVRPVRSDWVVKYIDQAAFNQNDGQAIIRITLSGDEITGALRTIDVPDKWSRAEAEKNAKKTPLNIAAGLAVLILAGLALSTFFRKHTGRKINVRVAWPWIALCVSANLVVGILWLDGTFSGFKPTMGWNLQLWMSLGGNLLGAGAVGILLLFMAQAIHAERPLAGASVKTDLILGTGLAVLLAGLYAAASLLFPSKETPPIYAADWSTYIPWLTVIFNGLKGFLKITIMIILTIGAARFLRSRLNVILCVVLLLVLSVATTLAADEVGAALVKQCIFVISLVVGIELIRRKQLGVLIATSGVGVALGQAGVANALYANAGLHALISAMVCLLATYGLLHHWHRNRVA
jgi:hypothetical protein